MSDYVEYAVTYDDPWRYGELPDTTVILTRAGYRELLRCVSKTTGRELNYSEICQVAPGFVALMRAYLSAPTMALARCAIGLPVGTAPTVPR